MKEFEVNKIIPNHKCSKLSDLDIKIVESVPEGGNWKNIPLDIPSKRLEQIRESFAQGKGSRSTYYGRLKRDMPSYTINTYFNRPGNGCHIHFEQNRVLSQREAARLQSFPDSHIFSGSMTAINNQIGNAVPPILAFQIAENLSKKLGKKGYFIDLFCGAGGLGLGFKLNGWTSGLASDIDKNCVETYKNNLHENVLLGDISDGEFFKKLVTASLLVKERAKKENAPFWILGGPPCQGFSTAGHKRTMDDERNHLFKHYNKLLSLVKPDGFVFENVAGLLSMQKGAVFEQVKKAFNENMKSINAWLLHSEKYGVPQRRKRVFLVGFKEEEQVFYEPPQITSLPTEASNNYPNSVSVGEAISDLPPLEHNEDASHKEYLHPPINAYQKFMRGHISAINYLSEMQG